MLTRHKCIECKTNLESVIATELLCPKCKTKHKAAVNVAKPRYGMGIKGTNSEQNSFRDLVHEMAMSGVCISSGSPAARSMSNIA